MEKKDIEIPFGAFDSELGGFEYTIPEGYKAEIKDGKVVVRKTESEDERIRKAIIATIHLYYGEPLENEAKEMIAWLEKQGEQKPADKIEPKFKEGDTIRLKDGDGRLWKIEKIREDGYTMIGHGLDETDFLFLDDKWEVVEPYQESNPTAPAPVRDNYDEIKQAETSPTLSNSSNIRKNAWSEEDEEMIRYIGNAITTNDATQYLNEKGICIIDAHVWFEKLKDRIQPQPKQEWSEEDKNRINRLIAYFEDKESFTAEDDIVYANWLKSLRPQNRWKPSEEQIDALEDAIVDAVSSIQKNMLNSLYSDLKKL